MTSVVAALDTVFELDELAFLARATGLHGIFGLDGGSGVIRVWGDARKGAASLVRRGLLTPDGMQTDERLLAQLLVLFAGPVRLGVTYAVGPDRAAVLASFAADGAYVAMPSAGEAAVAVRIVAVAHADAAQMLLAAGGGGEEDGPAGPERVVPLRDFMRLGERLLLDPVGAPSDVRADLLDWGLTPDEAGAMLDYLLEGGRSAYVQFVNTAGTVGVRDEQLWFGRGGRWWALDEDGDVARLRSVGAGAVAQQIRALAAEAAEAAA